jgi:hypothetical protein
LIDPGHGAGESVARGEGTGHDAGAAAEIQDRCWARQFDQLEVGLAVGHERRILAAELESFDEPLECRDVLLVDELHRVANLKLCRHRPSPVGHRRLS